MTTSRTTLSVPEKKTIQYVGERHHELWLARAKELNYTIEAKTLPGVPFTFDVATSNGGTVVSGSCCTSHLQFGWLKEPIKGEYHG